MENEMLQPTKDVDIINTASGKFAKWVNNNFDFNSGAVMGFLTLGTSFVLFVTWWLIVAKVVLWATVESAFWAYIAFYGGVLSWFSSTHIHKQAQKTKESIAKLNGKV